MTEYWNQQTREIAECLSSKDHSIFRSWDPVRLIPLYELHHWVGYFQGVVETSERLEGDELECWLKAMEPRRWGFDDYFFRRTEQLIRIRHKEISTTTYNAKSNHHIESYYQLTGRDVKDFRRIVEFGGGVGDLARLILDCGYEGEYVIVDLPEVLRLQKLNFRDSPVSPTFLEQPPAKVNDTLFISTWALSEVPVSLREKVIDAVDPDGWLIATQRRIFDIDNHKYFTSWPGVRQEIPWIRWDDGSYYIMK